MVEQLQDNGVNRKLGLPQAYETLNRATTLENLKTEEEDRRLGNVVYAGTSYENTAGNQGRLANGPGPIFDQRAYMYGRDPAAAQQAIQHASTVGNIGLSYGLNANQQAQQLANQARNRATPYGDFSYQNAALGTSMGYGGQLAGLEAQQGPSAAQAQLASGNNAAMAQQLAMARSGRGFGGGAAAMGQAQGNMAQIGAANANAAAQLRAQEDAAWRQRQAAALQGAAGIAQGVGSQYGQQVAMNQNAYLQNQAQGDQASLGYLGYGSDAMAQGIGQSIGAQGLENQIQMGQMSGNQAQDDRMLRAWAAQHGYDLASDQAQAQQTAALIQGGASLAAAAMTL